MVTIPYPIQVSKAIQLYREGKQQESRDCLRDFFLQQPSYTDALLWLAKVTPDPQEAIAAADLALKLDPGNEVAQRAVIAVQERESEPPGTTKKQAELSATITLSTGMTRSQAQAVIWRSRGINRPIGEALDDGTIGLRDLTWAIEHAWDTRIRDAARTILLTHLVSAEPQEPPAPLRVIVGSRFSERQERIGIAISVALAGALILLMVELLIVSFLTLVLQWKWPCWAAASLLPLIGLFELTIRITNRFSDQAEQYRKGRWGEDKAIETLRYSLDGRWTLWRNLEWPNRKWGDIDLILVGPGGVWALEVKAYSGRVRNVGDRWERKGRWRWRRLTTHPGQQARRNAARLKAYLENHGANVTWVQPIVVWAGDSENLTVQDPATPVWLLAELPAHVDKLFQDRSLSEKTMQQIANILEQAVKAAVKEE